MINAGSMPSLRRAVIRRAACRGSRIPQMSRRRLRPLFGAQSGTTPDLALVWTSDQPRETRLAAQSRFAWGRGSCDQTPWVCVPLADNFASWAWRHPQVPLELARSMRLLV